MKLKFNNYYLKLVDSVPVCRCVQRVCVYTCVCVCFVCSKIKENLFSHNQDKRDIVLKII